MKDHIVEAKQVIHEENDQTFQPGDRYRTTKQRYESLLKMGAVKLLKVDKPVVPPVEPPANVTPPIDPPAKEGTEDDNDGKENEQVGNVEENDGKAAEGDGIVDDGVNPADIDENPENPAPAVKPPTGRRQAR